MALSHLARRVGVPTLLRAAGPRFSPAAGARHLSYRSSQGKGHTNAFPDIDDLLKRSNNSYDGRCRMFKILIEDLDRAIGMWNEERNAFEKVVRKDLQDLARFREKFVKIVDGALVVSVGAFAVALGSRYLI
ncbi:unnamed protein product [Urochloa humidicola]